MPDALVALIVLPLVVACLAFFAGAGRGAGLTIAASGVQLALALWLAHDVRSGAIRIHAVGGWGAPLGIDLAADGLSALMLVACNAVAFAVAIYARAYFVARPRGGDWYWPLAGFLVAALNALFLSRDLFNLYVTLELLGLAAACLTALSGERRAVQAALRYLFATLLGSLAYLLGVALLYARYGTVAIETLSPLVAADPATLLAGGLIVLGLMVKTALYPLHGWLPPAHAGALTPVSALLSALVVKASFYLLLRLWFGPFDSLAREYAAVFLGVLGSIAILWGGYRALVEARLKMLVAYSTVAQIGYLFLVFALATTPGDDAAHLAWQGGVLHMLAHVFAKAAMFLAAGAIVMAAGDDRIAALAGSANRLPMTVLAFGIAGMSLMGLPLSGGFLAKWLLLRAALASGQWWWIIVMIAGGLLTAAYLFRVLRRAFEPVARGSHEDRPARSLEWVVLSLAMASLLLGLIAVPPLELLDAGAPR